jgi:hypothetical protein
VRDLAVGDTDRIEFIGTFRIARLEALGGRNRQEGGGNDLEKGKRFFKWRKEGSGLVT